MQVASTLLGSFEAFQFHVAADYETFLSRPVDAAGRDFFAGLLQRGILRDEQFVAILCATDEYFTRL